MYRGRAIQDLLLADHSYASGSHRCGGQGSSQWGHRRGHWTTALVTGWRPANPANRVASGDYSLAADIWRVVYEKWEELVLLVPRDI